MASTHTDAPATHDGADHDAEHVEHAHGDGLYIRVAVILGVFTAMEVSTYTNATTWGDAAVPAILVLMVVKFALVVLYFMHLKDDPKLLATMFSFGLGLAVAVYVMALMSFKFFA